MQREFSSLYPFLKLEFFGPDKKTKPSWAANILRHPTRIGEARRKQHDGCLELDDTMKVAELENELQETYGLNVQVFRKSGNVWLETTRSDDWTLKQQNDHGREISAVA